MHYYICYNIGKTILLLITATTTTMKIWGKTEFGYGEYIGAIENAKEHRKTRGNGPYALALSLKALVYITGVVFCLTVNR